MTFITINLKYVARTAPKPYSSIRLKVGAFNLAMKIKNKRVFGMETKTARVSARITPGVYSTLAEASELLGSTLNHFMVQAAFEKALAVIESEKKIRLNRASAEHICQLMENPPEPVSGMIEAIKAYKKDLHAED